MILLQIKVRKEIDQSVLFVPGLTRKEEETKRDNLLSKQYNLFQNCVIVTNTIVQRQKQYEFVRVWLTVWSRTAINSAKKPLFSDLNRLYWQSQRKAF